MEIVYSIFTLKDTCILDVINIFEIQLKSISESDAKSKVKDIILTLIKRENINYISCIEIINILPSQVNEHFSEVLVSKITKDTKQLKRLLYSEEGDSVIINPKDLSTLLQSINNHLLPFVILDIAIRPKHINLVKFNLNYYISFLNDYCENLETLKLNRLSLLNAFLTIVYSIILDNSFTLQERNNILTLAMINYSTKTAIQKYSSIVLLNKINKHNGDIQSFISNNFDFIMNSTLKKILYFKLSCEGKSTAGLSNYKLDVLNFFNSLILFLQELNDDCVYFYTGEFVKFLKRLFVFLDLYIKDKNFLVLDCLLEIMIKITKLVSDVITKLNISFKSCEEDIEDNRYIEYLKQHVNLSDSNIFRNLILRTAPLLLCNKIPIVLKTINIISNLICPLYYLPMKREENTNFSAEDKANVIIKSSLGSVFHEIWGYLLYLLKNAENVNLFKQIINLFIEVTRYYPRFFNESRLINDLIPNIEDGVFKLSKTYSKEQVNLVNKVNLELINLIVIKNVIERRVLLSVRGLIKLLLYYDGVDNSVGLRIENVLTGLKDLLIQSSNQEIVKTLKAENETLVKKYFEL
jgi:hypothetical protein